MYPVSSTAMSSSKGRPEPSRIGRKVVVPSTTSRGPVAPTRISASSRIASSRPWMRSELPVWKSHARVSVERCTPAPSSSVNTSLKRSCRGASAMSPVVMLSRSRWKAADGAMGAPAVVRRPRKATTYRVFSFKITPGRRNKIFRAAIGSCESSSTKYGIRWSVLPCTS